MLAVAQRRQRDRDRYRRWRRPSSGRGSSSSGRAVQSSSSGTSRATRRAAPRSAASTRRPSAGPRRPARSAAGRGSAITNRRQAGLGLLRRRAFGPGSPTSGPSASASRSASRRRSTSSRTRRVEPVAGRGRRWSVSRMPASALTMSASAAYVTFSPKGGQRPVRHVIRRVDEPLGVPEQLAHQPALADPGPAEDGDQLRGALARPPVQGVDQQAQLVLAVDQRGGVGGRLRRWRRAGRSASQTSVGVERPRRVDRRALLVARCRRWSARSVVPQTRTPPGGASDCSREAVLTTSPATIACPPSRAAATSTSASPVATPTRKLQPVGRRRGRSGPVPAAAPGRPVRSAAASVSVATGAPNSAITASPMYFSTTPPYWPTTRRAAAKNPVCSPRTSSGSERSTYGVKSIRSTKSTLIRRRSSCEGAPRAPPPVPPTLTPHAVQNAASTGSARAHCGHDRASSVPQRPQKRSSGPGCRPQLAQGALMLPPPYAHSAPRPRRPVDGTITRGAPADHRAGVLVSVDCRIPGCCLVDSSAPPEMALAAATVVATRKPKKPLGRRTWQRFC